MGHHAWKSSSLGTWIQNIILESLIEWLSNSHPCNSLITNVIAFRSKGVDFQWQHVLMEANQPADRMAKFGLLLMLRFMFFILFRTFLSLPADASFIVFPRGF
ncbi:hypothetical protein CR513_27705, partial [Mucuna pruriens]